MSGHDGLREQFKDQQMGADRGLNFRRVLWPSDTDALVIYAVIADEMVITALHRGKRLSGTEILSTCRERISCGRRMRVIGADVDAQGFYEKMLERKLIDGFSTESIMSFLAARGIE